MAKMKIKVHESTKNEEKSVVDLLAVMDTPKYKQDFEKIKAAYDNFEKLADSLGYRIAVDPDEEYQAVLLPKSIVNDVYLDQHANAKFLDGTKPLSSIVPVVLTYHK